jgi:two-component system, NarL family, response regulator
VYRAVRAGVLGYMLKDAPEEELLKSIYTVASGRNWMPPTLAGKLARRLVERDLTTRKIQVLAAITTGESNKEIGNALNISEATVKVHVTHILEKLKASGRTEAIRLAVQRGLVRMDSSLAA